VDTNPEYRMMAIVSLYSLLAASNKKFKAHLYFPSWGAPSKDEIDKLTKVCSVNPNASVELYTVPKKYDLILKMSSSVGRMPLGSMCYSRFLIPLMLESVDQCMYVDCDTLFTKDPFDFFDENTFSNSRFASTAGVSDPVRWIRPESLYSVPWYKNSGVLVMDLDLWRKRDLPQKYMFDAFTEGRHFNDQDTINCNEAPVDIPCELNFIAAWFNFNFKVSAYNWLYNKDYPDLEEALSKACIVHYTGGAKPFRLMKSMEKFSERLRPMLDLYSRTYSKFVEIVGKDTK
jgi:lipopolysaccharide biosynthesis glycosyltransferase